MTAVAAGGLLARTVGATVVLGFVEARGGRSHPAADEEPEAIPAGAGVAAGLEFERRRLSADSVASGLARLAAETNAEAVLVGSTHRGSLGRVVPGSMADQLVRLAPCPVGIGPRGFSSACPDTIRVVAAAFDGSREAEAAVRAAARVAELAEGTIRVFAVVPPLPEAVHGLPVGVVEVAGDVAGMVPAAPSRRRASATRVATFAVWPWVLA
jgi:nucleotide-binding universal stress UspA family protein